MSLIHIIGFGPKLQARMKFRMKWYSKFPETALNIDKGDSVIANLNAVHNTVAVDQIGSIVTHIKKHGGTLTVISAPLRPFGRDFSNYHFLPWHAQLISGIRNCNGLRIHTAEAVPSGVNSFLHLFSNRLIAPVCFSRIPNDVHVLMKNIDGCVSFNEKHIQGRILVIPPVISILHGESDSSARNELKKYLESLVSTILVHFLEPSEAEPDWLYSITIRNEDELKSKHQELQRELDGIFEEKTILAGDGYTLTRQVANILESIGFKTEEKEVEGKQDIEISEGEFEALVECTGSNGYFSIDKLRQLIDYLISDGDRPKGIFIGNPWKRLHPKERDLSEAFTENVVTRANQLEICLVTVPHLFRAYLDCETDEDRKQLRDSLKTCSGIWQYPVSDW